MNDAHANIDLEGCLNGRKDAWDAFVRHTAAIIYSAVQRSLRTWPHTRQDIEDRVQDVYVKLFQDDFRLLRQYDSRRAALSTWLTLVSRSTVRDYMQKRRIETVPLSNFDHADFAAPPSHNQSHTPAQHQSLTDADSESATTLPGMDLLTDRQREVLAMLFEQGMTVEQAAVRLGVDPQTIRSTKHKAITRLREQMDLEQN